VDLSELRGRVRGNVVDANERGFDELRASMVWNRLRPARRPQAIVQVCNEADVIETIRFARSHDLKVAVRGGGHSWVGYSVRDRTILIDLSRLSGCSIDALSRRAAIGPVVQSRDFIRALASHRLAFPVGHCPTVPMSGFLLNGGLGWNFQAWKPGCFTIESARVVTAAGEVAIASENENPELLWALQGGGPGFFGAITEYTLRLFPAPAAILTNSYFYPLEFAPEIGAWAANLARELPNAVEMTLAIALVPPELSEKCVANGGRALLVTASAFASSIHDAEASLARLDECPCIAKSMLAQRTLPTRIEELQELIGAILPEGHRILADTMWSNAPARDILGTAVEHFARAPSPKSSVMVVPMTGGQLAQFPDAAYSMTGDSLVLCYGIWERAEDDAVNSEWHRATIAALDRYAAGHFVGESDIVSDPRRAERSYAAANWQRLQDLRAKYDPRGMFTADFSK
jgi:FAD/FMN-containing dehydrogenase